jgi:hypothetical protein
MKKRRTKQPIRSNPLAIIPRRILPGVVTATSRKPRKGMKSEHWMSAGTTLCEIEGTVQFRLGDWWAFGEHRYGKRAQAIRDGELGDYSFQTSGTRRSRHICTRMCTTTAEQWDVIAEFLKKLAAAMRNTVAALDEVTEEEKTLASGRG